MSEPTWELLGGGGVVGGPIVYVGNWAAGTAYQPGQVVSYNGVDYLAVNPSTGQIPPAASPLAGGDISSYTSAVNLGPTGVTATGNGDAIVNMPSANFLAVPHYFDFSCRLIDAAGNASLEFRLHDGAAPGPLVGSVTILTPATNPGSPQFIRLMFTPIAGAHIYQLRWRDITGGRQYTVMNSSYPMIARIYKAAS